MRKIPAFLQLRLSKQTTLMKTCLMAALLPTVLTSSSKPCSSNEVATGARCCQACPPGSGVITRCNTTSDTQCESCIENESYSPNSSHELPCQPCTKCPENSHAVVPCNGTQDTVCQCDRNYFWNEQAQRCDLCDLCSIGQGAWQLCSPLQNSRCRRCVEGTFSARRSIRPCKPCTVCTENQLMLQRCRLTEDTVCMNISSAQKPTILPLFPKTLSTLPQNATDAGKSDILPVYCALLAGLVVGLVAYVIVLQVRRNRARRAKTAYTCSSASVREGARLAPGGSTPQIPTQGSDSGVFVDNDVKTVTLSPSFRVRDLPPPLKRALETSIHALPENRGGWRTLARQLGYNSSRASAFHTRAIRDDALPARYMLSDWCKKSHATVGALQVALHKIGRDDVTVLFHTDQVANQPNHRRSRESINGALGRSNSTNQDHRSKSVGLNNLEGGARAEPVSPHRNHRRSVALSMNGSQRLVDI